MNEPLLKALVMEAGEAQVRLTRLYGHIEHYNNLLLEHKFCERSRESCKRKIG